MEDSVTTDCLASTLASLSLAHLPAAAPAPPAARINLLTEVASRAARLSPISRRRITVIERRGVSKAFLREIIHAVPRGISPGQLIWGKGTPGPRNFEHHDPKSHPLSLAALTKSTGLSFVELCILCGLTQDVEGRPFFGNASTFVSYGWHGTKTDEQIASLLAQTREDPSTTTFYWFDIFAVAQNQTSDFEKLNNTADVSSFERVVANASITLAYWTPFSPEPTPTVRVWCLYELLLTHMHGNELRIFFKINAEDGTIEGVDDDEAEKPDRNTARLSLENIRSLAAGATYEDDWARIHLKIELLLHPESEFNNGDDDDDDDEEEGEKEDEKDKDREKTKTMQKQDKGDKTEKVPWVSLDRISDASLTSLIRENCETEEGVEGSPEYKGGKLACMFEAFGLSIIFQDWDVLTGRGEWIGGRGHLILDQLCRENVRRALKARGVDVAASAEIVGEVETYEDEPGPRCEDMWMTEGVVRGCVSSAGGKLALLMYYEEEDEEEGGDEEEDEDDDNDAGSASAAIAATRSSDDDDDDDHHHHHGSAEKDSGTESEEDGEDGEEGGYGNTVVGLFDLHDGELETTLDWEEYPLHHFVDLSSSSSSSTVEGLVASADHESTVVKCWSVLAPRLFDSFIDLATVEIKIEIDDDDEEEDVGILQTVSIVEQLAVLSGFLVVLQKNGRLSLWEPMKGTLLSLTEPGVAVPPLVNLGDDVLLAGSGTVFREPKEILSETTLRTFEIWEVAPRSTAKIAASSGESGSSEEEEGASPWTLMKRTDAPPLQIECEEFADAGNNELALSYNTAEAKEVHIFSCTSRTVVRSRAANDSVLCIAASPAARIVGVSDFWGVEVWDTETLELKHVLSMGDATFGVRIITSTAAREPSSPGEQSEEEDWKPLPGGETMKVWVAASDQRGNVRWWEL